MNGEIVQERPLPRYFKQAAPCGYREAKIETYRREKIVFPGLRELSFYVLVGDDLCEHIVRVFTSLCMFKRESENAREVLPKDDYVSIELARQKEQEIEGWKRSSETWRALYEQKDKREL